MRFLFGLFRRRDPTAPKVDWVSGARKPGVCCQCGRSLTAVPGGVYFGASVKAALDATTYPCRSCGTDFCIDCMARLKRGRGICPYYLGDIGWG